MTAAICPSMHNTIADSIYNSIVSKSSKYYYFLGKTVPYSLDPTTGIEQVEVPKSTYKYELSTRRDIISMKQITNNDVSYVVTRYNWTSGEIYDHYDDSYTADNPAYSGATSINTAKFYVMTSNYNVYMCLDNNYNSESNIMPSGYDVLPFVTSDGYKWKYMMNIPLALRSKFLTSLYMPITTAVNSIFYNNGAIDTVLIDSVGSGYPSNSTASITITNPQILAGAFTVGKSYVITNLGTAASLQTKWNTTAGTTGVTYAIGSTFTAANTGSALTGAIVNGNGIGAILTPYISTVDGSISTVKITNGGTGYLAGTTLTVVGTGTGKITGNTAALLTPVIVNGVITHVSINDPGKNYNNNATNLTITSDTGLDAHLSAVVKSGQIVDVIIDNPGYGYKDAKISAIGTGGSGAKFTALVTGGKLDTIQANVELLTTEGTIDYIKITSGGSGYNSITVNIVGDGQEATAVAVIENSTLKKINITNRGYGYTYANITLTPNGGNNPVIPTARAIIAPKYGYGRNALSELYASTLMFYSTISQDNSTGFDISNDYRQFGIVKNPNEFDSTQLLFAKTGVACYSVNVSVSSGSTITTDMPLTDSNGKKYVVIAINGNNLLLQPVDNSILTSGITLTNGSISVAIVAINFEPTVDKYSGDLLYIDNRSAFYQTTEQTVTLQTILKF